MSRAAALRRSLFWAGLGGVVASLGGSSCQSGTPASTCSLAEVASYAGSPLMSLADARLDRIGDGFLLLGADKDVVRWVSIDGQRNAGKEQSAAVPAARKLGPWFAAAGRNTPGDTILIVYGTVAANGTDLDLMVVAAVADGSAAPGPAVAVTTIVGGAKIGAAPQIALGTSQSGMRAGLAWTAPGSDALTALMLGGDAQGVGASFPVDTATARVGCVGFVPGKDDLSLAYYRYQSDSDTQPVWVIAETHESGMITSTLALDLLDQSPSCPLLVSTSGGYALAWQNAAGSTLGTYVFVGNSFAAHLFAGAVEFGGPTLQPPLAGLGLAGNDFAVVVARVGAGQVWRVSAEGARVSGALVFPSESGNLGTISSVPVTGALFSTYADYPAGATTSASSGQRYLVETTCL